MYKKTRARPMFPPDHTGQLTLLPRPSSCFGSGGEIKPPLEKSGCFFVQDYSKSYERSWKMFLENWDVAKLYVQLYSSTMTAI